MLVICRRQGFGEAKLAIMERIAGQAKCAGTHQQFDGVRIRFDLGNCADYLDSTYCNDYSGRTCLLIGTYAKSCLASWFGKTPVSGRL